MEQKKEEYLYSKYPKFFANKDLPMTQTCMCWGIECGSGWFNLLDELCAKITELAKDLPDKSYPRADQVKSKFATLRVYISGGNDAIYKAIDEAEKKSETICEICGKDGDVRENRGWVTTLCDECQSKKE